MFCYIDRLPVPPGGAEYNCNLPLGDYSAWRNDTALQYDHSDVMGSGLSALNLAAAEFGYRLVYVEK